MLRMKVNVRKTLIICPGSVQNDIVRKKIDENEVQIITENDGKWLTPGAYTKC